MLLRTQFCPASEHHSHVHHREGPVRGSRRNADMRAQGHLCRLHGCNSSQSQSSSKSPDGRKTLSPLVHTAKYRIWQGVSTIEKLMQHQRAVCCSAARAVFQLVQVHNAPTVRCSEELLPHS